MGRIQQQYSESFRFLSSEQLSKLTTPRLMAYKNALWKTQCHVNQENYTAPTSLELAWDNAYANVVAELGTREHVEKTPKPKKRHAQKKKNGK